MYELNEAQLMKNASKKSKKPLIIGLGVAFLAVVAAVAIVLALPKMKIEKAKKLYEEGKTTEAVAILVDLKQDDAQELVAGILSDYCDDFVGLSEDALAAANRYTKTFSNWLTMKALSSTESFTIEIDRTNSDVKKMVSASNDIYALRKDYTSVFTKEINEKLNKDLKEVSDALVESMDYSYNMFQSNNYETWLFSKFGSGLSAHYTLEELQNVIAKLASAVGQYLD